jgi:hypothetical protein
MLRRFNLSKWNDFTISVSLRSHKREANLKSGDGSSKKVFIVVLGFGETLQLSIDLNHIVLYEFPD